MFAWRRSAAAALVIVAGATLAIGATAPVVRPRTAAPPVAKPAISPATKPGAPAPTATPVYIEPLPAPARRPYPNAFPEGEGFAVADRACMFCHSPMLVTQQAKDSLGWEKTLTQMVTFGAPLTPAEHDTLHRYLLARFGPRVAAPAKTP